MLIHNVCIETFDLDGLILCDYEGYFFAKHGKYIIDHWFVFKIIMTEEQEDPFCILFNT